MGMEGKERGEGRREKEEVRKDGRKMGRRERRGGGGEPRDSPCSLLKTARRRNMKAPQVAAKKPLQ